MAEPVAVAKKKRQRRKASDALLKITVERIDTAQSSLGVVEGSFVAQTNRITVLEQSMPESKFDLAKVIKAINGL
jgi:hypothetical protein